MRKFTLTNVVLAIVLMMGLLIGTAVLGMEYYGDYGEQPEPKKEEPQKGCPVTNYTENMYCSSCHILMKDSEGNVKFGVKEVKPYNQYDMPPKVSIINGVLTYLLENVASDEVKAFLEYAERHPELGKRVVIEIDSFGGSIFEAWRIKSYIVKFERKGYIIETQTYGTALSAGFIIFVSGTKGYRFVDLNAEFMMHELWSIEWPQVATPSSKEEEAKVYRHLQDNINDWITSRGNLTKKEMDELVKFKSYWLVGRRMIELGFADGLING